MRLQRQVLLGGETPVLENSPVESFPVITGKKLSSIVKEYVGDFSLIPTSAIDHIERIGNTQKQVREKGINTKSARKGWRMTAAW